MGEENSLSKKSQVNESSGEWGSRKGKKFTFKNSIIDINDIHVYPLTYKSINEEKTEDGKELIVLKLSNDNMAVKFYKEELYEKFGMRVRRKKKEGRKARSLSLTDAEYDFIKKIVLKLLDEEDSAKLLMSKSVEEMKKMLGITKDTKHSELVK